MTDPREFQTSDGRGYRVPPVTVATLIDVEEAFGVKITPRSAMADFIAVTDDTANLAGVLYGLSEPTAGEKPEPGEFFKVLDFKTLPLAVDAVMIRIAELAGEGVAAATEKAVARGRKQRSKAADLLQAEIEKIDVGEDG